ncbi:hypothetical protein JK203_08970 [Gluconobacter cerinus]|uniref:hypothetical protein n=1 Tax=Gluconobacter cerinus TaxID=38307 RepID=UPI001B8D89C4|nr:hypothetical protein [Gluconobacter cerinus]MBS1040980.1 hypothetical protein [Gluconobacter cerinus]MBS1047959.1 hypothetical protein [Gluconobacter cerinus]
MTQNTEQNVRTREEQIADLTNLFGEEGTFTFVDDRDAATKHILEAEARGAEEQRRKDGEGCEMRRENALLRTAMSTVASYTRGYAKPTCSVDFLSSAVPEEVRIRIAALEAEIASLKEAEQLARADAEASKTRVKVLEAENAALQAWKIGAVPEPVPYSDPIRTMSTEQLCQRLQVLRARWDELMDSDEEMGGGSPMESMDEEMQSLENEISRRAALTREGGV